MDVEFKAVFRVSLFIAWWWLWSNGLGAGWALVFAPLAALFPVALFALAGTVLIGVLLFLSVLYAVIAATLSMFCRPSPDVQEKVRKFASRSTINRELMILGEPCTRGQNVWCLRYRRC